MATRNDSVSALFCSKGVVHPTVWARNSLNDILLGLSNCEVSTTNSIKFKRLIDKYQPNMMVLYFHEKTVHPEDLTALDDYVTKGGSILAIHSVSASFKQEPTFHQLLGGRFIKHGPICNYTIQPTSSTIKLFSSLDSSFSIKDELYIHEYSDDVLVLLETELDGHQEPVAWVKNHGKGKVAYFAPGHKGNVFKDVQAQGAIQELIKWSLDYE